MTEQELLSQTHATFAGVFGSEVPFRADLARVDEPRWTSLKHVEFIIALESTFNVRFDGADATDMVSMPIVFERIRRKLQ
jgi:acyl carrier protein